MKDTAHYMNRKPNQDTTQTNHKTPKIAGNHSVFWKKQRDGLGQGGALNPLPHPKRSTKSKNKKTQNNKQQLKERCWRWTKPRCDRVFSITNLNSVPKRGMFCFSENNATTRTRETQDREKPFRDFSCQRGRIRGSNILRTSFGVIALHELEELGT